MKHPLAGPPSARPRAAAVLDPAARQFHAGLWLLALAFALWALSANAEPPPVVAGRVELVTGDVRFIDAAKKNRRPAKGDPVLSGETIVSGRDGEVHLTMEDSGYLAVRPNTQLKVVDYRARGDKEDRSILRLIEGTFRSITGWIPRVSPRSYRIETITATIGVRGTDHEPMFLPKGSPLGPPGTYDKVNEGETSLEDKSGVVYIPPNTAGYSSLQDGVRARLLERIPDFFKGTPNENLLSGKHKSIQERLQERLDERLRLNQEPGAGQTEPRSGVSGEKVEQGLESGAKGGAVPEIPLPGVAVPGAAIPAILPGAAGAAGAAVPPVGGGVPGIPIPEAAPAVAPAAPPAPPAPSSPLAAPAPDKSSSAPPAAPAGRPESRKPGLPRGAPATGGAPAVKPEASGDPADRQRAYDNRRRELQSDHRGQYERDRDTDLNRDADRVREADRVESRRRREQR